MNAPPWAPLATPERPHRRPTVPRWRPGRTVLWLAFCIGVMVEAAAACDLCAIYTATQVQQTRTGLSIGVAEQLTYFATLRDDGEKLPDNGESMTSSITQVVAGYNVFETLGVQLNLPIISRTYTRLQGEGFEHGDETGIGDMALVALYTPLRYVGTDSVASVLLLGGLKLPTGDSGRLREELDETPQFPDVPGRGLPGFFFPDAVTNHDGHGGGSESGLHGHDLALGSGSLDGIVGADLYGSWKRLYARGSVQYFIRSQGSYDYQYANELLWQVGPGAYLALDDTGLGRGYTLGLAALFSGETKGLDRLSGEKLGDTGFTGLYLGPGMTFTWGESLSAMLSGELPVLQNTSSPQLVPDYRIRAGLTWRF